jgi:arginase
MNAIAIIEAPSTLGLSSHGVERLPDALIGAGLTERLGARRFGRIEPPPRDPERDPETLLLNPQGIADYAVALADAIGEALEVREFPLVLGGDCSILLGSLLALRRRGRFGLLFLDGHADFYQPEAEPNGEVASMELALATGRGPRLVTEIEGFAPLVRDEDVVVFGRRDGEEADAHGSQRIEDTGIHLIELDEIRRDGARLCMEHALARLDRPELQGFWFHIDVDVLDDSIMPAVDYRMAGGLSWDELILAISSARNSSRLIGMQVTIFNPALDSDGAIAANLVDALAAALRSL